MDGRTLEGGNLAPGYRVRFSKDGLHVALFRPDETPIAWALFVDEQNPMTEAMSRRAFMQMAARSQIDAVVREREEQE